MAAGAAGSGLGRRRRRRRIGVVTLIVIAVAASAICMAALTARAMISSGPCRGAPVTVQVAVSTDIAPAIQTVARSFNHSSVASGGRCVRVAVTPGDPATQASQIDGQTPPGTGAAPDAWIPDSSLWVDLARTVPVGAEKVAPTGISVARSPLLLVTTPAVAAATHVFDVPPGWNVLLPPADGGPPASSGLAVELPDPTASAAGLTALLQVSRILGTSAAARTAFTEFVLSAEPTENFDSPQALGQFVASTLAPFDRRAVTVASEQAVLAYDRAEPKAPVVARYPTGPAAALGSPELDYPYVVTAASRAMGRAAAAFGRYLTSSYARSVIRYYGFRDTAGVPDAMPAALAAQPLQLASTPTASEAATGLQAYEKLGLGSRDLTLIDVSPAMGQLAGFGSLTLEQELTQTASRGLALFPDSTQMGLWEIGRAADASKSYQQLVPIGPLPAAYGVITRRTQLQQIIATLHAGTRLALHDAILAAYQDMSSTYAPNHANAVLVLTSGVDSAPGDMSLDALLARLHSLDNPGKKVEIVIIMFGRRGDFPALQQIAGATGGAAYQISNPAEVGKIFIEALSQRMCDQGCVTP